MFNKELIEELINVKSKIEKYDIECLYKQFMPNFPASEKSIVEVEKKLGYKINEEYRNFLGVANGWTNFFQTVTLFGTSDLLDSELSLYAKQGIRDAWVEAVEATGFLKDELLPIAATKDNIDLFLMAKPYSNEPGIIIWFAAYEIERYTSFNEFFSKMIEYNKLDVDYFKNKGSK